MRLSPASGAKVEVSPQDDIVVRVHDESGMSVVKQLRARAAAGSARFSCGHGSILTAVGPEFGWLGEAAL
jgi:hypothetical protein